MRRFEFAEGGSAKFWEIGRDGSEVTVRWGRAGTGGQTKVKDFDDPAAAAAHETKLVAEKTKKGYAESPAGTTAAPPQAGSSRVASRDEDTFVFPPAWYRHRYARRGSSGTATFTPEPDARAIVERATVYWFKPGHSARTTDLDVAPQAAAWEEGEPDATPLGAAAAIMARGLRTWPHADQLVLIADAWIAERGLRFAAEAATELMSRTVKGADIAPRVRHALAAASDDDYADVVAALTPYRAGHLRARAATSVLVPTQHEWVSDDITDAVAVGDEDLAAFLTAAAGTEEQLNALVPVAKAVRLASSMPSLVTMVDGVGAGAAAALFSLLGHPHTAGAEYQRRLLSVLGQLPGDEVMQGLIDRVDHKYVAPALLTAAERYPVRAMRLLAGAASKRTVPDLLRAHVLVHPELVDRMLPQLAPEAAKRVEAIVGDAPSLRVAPLSAVPSVLVGPRSQHREKAAKPVVLGDLRCREPARIDWADEERDTWAATSFYRYGPAEDGEPWESWWHRIQADGAGTLETATFFATAPEDCARPLLAGWQPADTEWAWRWMRVIIARFGLDALPLALTMARRSPADTFPILAPFFSAEVAVLMAEWFARLKTVRPTALAWLLRHADPAARALVPAALAKAGVSRRQAENALLALHHNGRGDTVRAAAREYGAEAAAAIDALLDADPLTMLAAKIPTLPGWAAPDLLPPVELRDGSGVLPVESVPSLIAVLALSQLDAPYAGVDVVKAACDPASLAEFGWALFQRWQMAGSPSKGGWVLDALGLTGDDETVRLLSPLVLAWPGAGGHTKAVAGLSVLAAIGTDVALMHLHGIAQRAKPKGLRAAAEQKMDEVAAGLGLSAEQLADRLVPGLGLDDDGSMRLDYGPRQFTVGFDEQLRPFVADAAGGRLKALPKPGVRDDGELAPAAYRTFTGLKKDLRTIAADQIRRLERAMVTGRRWTGAEFRQLFVSHPLLWHVVRRLVWGRYDESGALIDALRVAEDRSFATVDDEETTLADDATVGVAHPLQLGDTLPDWVEVFADYGILPPFPQLSRPTFTLTAEEAASSRLGRFEGLTVPTGRVIGLERRGWRREAPQDGGIQECIVLAVHDEREVVIELDPGVVLGGLDIAPEQKLDRIYLWNGDASRWASRLGTRSEDLLALGELDAITASEVVRDLTEITA